VSAAPTADWSAALLRALLFVPGNDRRKLARAGTAGADMIVIDLEDAVAEAEKTAARAVASEAIAALVPVSLVAVRVNGVESSRLEDDIAAVTRPGLAAIVVPKVEDLDALAKADQALSEAETAHGLHDGAIGLLAILETPRGIARCEEILFGAPARTITALFGLADFAAALGVDITDQGSELFYARARLIVAARAAGLAAPIDGPFLRVDDLDGLLADSRRARAAGFQGRLALHPRQIEPIQRAFSDLSEEQLAAARRVVQAFEGAEASGVASIRVDGQFVDYPLYHMARAKLRRYEAYRGAAPW
jgi:citrate lyase subunit beta/citryl-CoA lyase